MNLNSQASYYQGGQGGQLSLNQAAVSDYRNIPSQSTIGQQPNQAAMFVSDLDIVNDGLVDPVLKCRDLCGQLRQSLQVI